jgi:2,4-dienoyl-CoA reductase-like NADH-dependent reductase (Old Yellow Enzyme family)
MLNLATDLDLESRLASIARRMGKTPAECALAALRSWIEDHEEAAARAQAFGGDGVHRADEDFLD